MRYTVSFQNTRRSHLHRVCFCCLQDSTSSYASCCTANGHRYSLHSLANTHLLLCSAIFSRALQSSACAITGAMSSEAATSNTNLVDQIHFYQVCFASAYWTLDMQAILKQLILPHKSNMCVEFIHRSFMLQAEKSANSKSQWPATPAQLLEVLFAFCMLCCCLLTSQVWQYETGTAIWY